MGAKGESGECVRCDRQRKTGALFKYGVLSQGQQEASLKGADDDSIGFLYQKYLFSSLRGEGPGNGDRS